MRPTTLNRPNSDVVLVHGAQMAVDFDTAIGRPGTRKVFEDIERRGLDRLQEFLWLTEEPIDAGMRELPHPSRVRNLRIPCPRKKRTVHPRCARALPQYRLKPCAPYLSQNRRALEAGAHRNGRDAPRRTRVQEGVIGFQLFINSWHNGLRTFVRVKEMP